MNLEQQRSQSAPGGKSRRYVELDEDRSTDGTVVARFVRDLRTGRTGWLVTAI